MQTAVGSIEYGRSEIQRHGDHAISDGDSRSVHRISHRSAATRGVEQHELEVMTAAGGIAPGSQPALVGERGGLGVEWNETGEAAKRREQE